jgi:Cdc6-like AAA superfamily ATPase
MLNENLHDLVDKISEEKKPQAEIALSALVEKPQRGFSESCLNPDAEYLTPEEDLADRYKSIKVIVNTIIKAKPPYTFCINGGWGTGKTVYMHWIYDSINERYKDEIKVIWFEPWKYESVGNLIYPLVKKIEIIEWWCKVIRWKLIGHVILPIIYLLGYVKCIPLVAIEIFKEIWSIFGKDKKNESSYEKIDKLKIDFEKYVNYILIKEKKKKLIIFIDDLDRCLPENVIQLFESIKNIFYTDKCIFVMGVNKGIISHAIAHKYGSLNLLDGEEYTEKIIKFTFDLPTELRNIIPGIVQEYKKMNNDIFSESLIPEISTGMFLAAQIYSIRLIKKIFTKYILIINNIEQTALSTVNKDALFLTILLYHKYPEFCNILKKHQPGLSIIDSIVSIGKNTDYMSDEKMLSKQPDHIKYAVHFIKTTQIKEILTAFNRGSENKYKEAIYHKSIELIERLSL